MGKAKDFPIKTGFPCKLIIAVVPFDFLLLREFLLPPVGVREVERDGGRHVLHSPVAAGRKVVPDGMKVAISNQCLTKTSNERD